MIRERVITIEYLAPSMSKNLLCKFPDASAFDFNYSESGIWSPLLPRGRIGSEVALQFSEREKSRRSKGRSIKNKKKKKVMNGASVVNRRLDFSPSSVTPKKGWNRLLKAAAKRFKNHRRAAIQMMLPTL